MEKDLLKDDLKLLSILSSMLQYCNEHNCNIDVSTTRNVETNKVERVTLNITTFDSELKPSVETCYLQNEN